MRLKRPMSLPTPVLMVAVLLSLLPAGQAWAASICGTVIDAVSGDPVPQAGIFLRTSAGAYTGDNTATDLSGHYCLSGLLPGTYTLEVRVDDHVVYYRTGIVVADDVSQVPAAVELPRVRLARPWPNPSPGATKMRLDVRRTAPVVLSVYDARGRLIRSWSSPALEPGSHDYRWDGTALDGRPSPSGLYFIQVRSGRESSTRPLVLVR